MNVRWWSSSRQFERKWVQQWRKPNQFIICWSSHQSGAFFFLLASVLSAGTEAGAAASLIYHSFDTKSAKYFLLHLSAIAFSLFLAVCWQPNITPRSEEDRNTILSNADPLPLHPPTLPARCLITIHLHGNHLAEWVITIISIWGAWRHAHLRDDEVQEWDSVFCISAEVYIHANPSQKLVWLQDVCLWNGHYCGSKHQHKMPEYLKSNLSIKCSLPLF